MSESFVISRKIGIDMGHRVTHHHSKCRNLHGHRYEIEALLQGDLANDGSEEGMVMDFGFVKELMMREIDSPCDHGTTLWVDDPLLYEFLKMSPECIQLDAIRRLVDAGGSWLGLLRTGKTYVVPFVPTVENLCKHWYERIAPLVKTQTHGRAHLVAIKAWETPNGYAIYPG